MNKLFYSLNPSTEILCTDNGLPVWAVPDNTVLAELNTLCALYNCTTEPVLAVEERSVINEGLVVAFNAQLREEALLYAHLTQRRFEAIPTLGKLKESSLPDVLMVMSTDITPDLLNYIYGTTNQGTATGLLICYDKASFKTQVLYKAALLHCSFFSSGNTIADLFFTSPINSFTHKSYKILGSSSDATDIRKVIHENNALLNIVTHSDGIDAYLGPTVLCPVFKRIKHNHTDPPLCIISGHCYRTNLPLNKTIENLVSPQEIRTKILLWMTCRGLRLAPSMINPLWGLAPQFMENKFIGAVITPWKIVFANPSSVLLFYKKVMITTNIGEAVFLFNNTRSVETAGNKVCLIGDPKLKCPKNMLVKEIHKMYKTKAGLPFRDEEISEIAFLRYYLHIALEKSKDEKKDLVSNALLDLGIYETSLTSSRSAAKDIGQTFRKSFLESVLSRKKELVVDYIGKSSGLKLTRKKERCFVCTGYTEVYAVNFGTANIDSRTVSICPLCGIISDKNSKGNDLGLSIKGNQIYLTGKSLLEPFWNAILLFDYKIPSYSRSMHWPQDNNGRPATSVILNAELTAGPVYVTLVIIAGSALTVLRYPYRIGTITLIHESNGLQ